MSTKIMYTISMYTHSIKSTTIVLVELQTQTQITSFVPWYQITVEFLVNVTLQTQPSCQQAKLTLISSA